jgi:hypothetical protein
MFHLLDLPSHVLIGVFTDWLDLPALVALDSSCCNVESRKSFLHVVTSCVACFHHLPCPPLLHSKGMQWYVTRKAKVKRIVIDESRTDSKLVWLFFKTIGSSLQSLNLKNSLDGYSCYQQKDLTDMVKLCPRLQTLVVENFSKLEGKLLGELFEHCSALRCIRFDYCYVTGELGTLHLPNLQMLHISDCTIYHENINRLIASSPNLRSFHCGDLPQKEGYFNALATHCPRLQVLSYGENRPSVAALKRVLQRCQEIEVVSMYSRRNENAEVERDEHIAAIMGLCPRLKAFRAGDAGQGVTAFQAALMDVATRVKDLRHLYLNGLDSDEDTAKAVRAIAPHCGNMKSLQLQFDRSTDCNALAMLVTNLHNVEELSIFSGYNNVVLKAIAANCPLLRKLNLCFCRGYSEEGLAAIALKCTALELVTHHQWDGVLNPFGQTMWKKMRPNIQFTSYPALCSLWQKYLDVEREELVIW